MKLFVVHDQRKMEGLTYEAKKPPKTPLFPVWILIWEFCKLTWIL